MCQRRIQYFWSMECFFNFPVYPAIQFMTDSTALTVAELGHILSRDPHLITGNQSGNRPVETKAEPVNKAKHLFTL